MSMKLQRKQLNDPHAEHDAANTQNEEVRHPAGDTNVRLVYQFLIGLGVFLVVTYVLVFGIIKWNEARIGRENTVVTHVAKSKSEQLPAEPRLQLAPGHATHPLAEGLAYRDSVARALESYGYLNRDSGWVRIPIDLAKDIIVKRGLPTRATNQATPAVMIPDYSSSGRTEIARDQRIPGGMYTVTGGNLNVREAGK